MRDLQRQLDELRAELRRHQGGLVRWASAGPAAGGDLIIVRPIDVCPGIGFLCDCAESEVIFNPCGGSPAPGTIVNVWARAGKLFNYPPEILFETEFWAAKVGNGEGLIQRPDGDYGEQSAGACVWIAVVPVGLCVESSIYTGS